MHIDVILPLAFNQIVSYTVSLALQSKILPGVRVEVPLRNKYYSGLVYKISEVDHLTGLRNIHAVLDDRPIVTTKHYSFWNWLSKYYVCSLGEVMSVALPTGLKLNSETIIESHPEYQEGKQKLSNKEHLLMESLAHQNELKVDALKDILQQKSVHHFLKTSFSKKLIVIKETLKEKYKPRLVDYVKFCPVYESGNHELAFKITQRSEKQTRAVFALAKLGNDLEFIPKSLLYKTAKINAAEINALQKKGILEVYKLQESRLKKINTSDISEEYSQMSDAQTSAYHSVMDHWKDKSVCLLHGITGSGKTKIFTEIIRKVLEDDDSAQVLYLLPEIALTTQIIGRIEKEFGNHVTYFHSRMNSHQQVELWNEILCGKSIVVGARSSLFLPFQNLKLIIVDEEHDHSFKQQDPSPRYNARDAAMILAIIFKAKVLLGSATPSLESYINAKNGKYGYVSLNERFGKAILPKIEVVDLIQEEEQLDLEIPISQSLKMAIRQCLNQNEQAIIFQNRRGYAPSLKCYKCGWQAGCDNCDVSLTVHQLFNEIRCHYCGNRQSLRSSCPSCGHHELKMIGYGTEKIEDVFKKEFSDATVARMDHDTVRSKTNYEKLLYRLENREIDILVGTQMITKGLDFDHITLVGILDAEKLFHFPDFRSTERAYQLLTQVAGRAGRRSKQGTVILQTSNIQNPTLDYVLKNDFESATARELFHRKNFNYPPFIRLIAITIKHHKRPISQDASKLLLHHLQSFHEITILGPAVPHIAKVRNKYLYQILLKFNKSYKNINGLKSTLLELKAYIKKQSGMSAVRINIDVDPY